MENLQVVKFFILFNLLWKCSAKNKGFWDKYIIACHTTDFSCFKRQYLSLRDNVLLGNDRLGLDLYEPYTFEYGDSGTCVKISGLEESQLAALSMDSNNHEFSYTLHAPLKLQQFTQNNVSCKKPEIDFGKIPSSDSVHKKKFKANGFESKIDVEDRDSTTKPNGRATIQAMFPYDLLRKKNEVYLILREEDIDLILDIPDLSNHNKKSKFEETLYESSEWAYEVVQHIDAAKHVVLPYTARFRKFFTQVPLRKIILLYPDEKFTDIVFDFYDESSKSETN